MFNALLNHNDDVDDDDYVFVYACMNVCKSSLKYFLHKFFSAFTSPHAVHEFQSIDNAETHAHFSVLIFILLFSVCACFVLFRIDLSICID